MGNANLDMQFNLIRLLITIGLFIVQLTNVVNKHISHYTINM